MLRNGSYVKKKKICLEIFSSLASECDVRDSHVEEIILFEVCSLS